MKKTKNTKPPREPRCVVKIPGGPIDWAAWVAEASQPRGNKGKKMSPEMCAKFSVAQKARFKRQRDLLAEAHAAKPPPPPAPMRVLTVEQNILANMEPGSWYSTRDLHQASGEHYGSCKAMAPKLHRDGIFSRAQNPAWKPPERVGQQQEPKWIYGLTEAGLLRRRLAAALG